MPVPRPLALAPVAVLASLALLAAGCGGGGSPQVAGVAGTTTGATPPPQNDQSRLVAFSRCMRSNGVPSFPDPQRYVSGNAKLTIHGYGTGSPQFRAALRTCNGLLPSGPGGSQDAAQLRTRIADELSFARCMRGHGVAGFPDPTAQGELSVAMVQAQGIDVHVPAFLRVVQACLPASHGELTAAKVREAIANAAP